MAIAQTHSASLLLTPDASSTPQTTTTTKPTKTPFFTSTPINTSTVTLPPTLTFTPTSPPSIGDTVECGEYFSVKVLKPIEFRKYSPGYASETAVGSFLVIYFELINNTSSTWNRLWSDDYQVTGTLNGKTFTFDANTGASLDWWLSGYVKQLFDDPVPPGLPFHSAIVFMLSQANNWVLVFHLIILQIEILFAM